MADHRRRRRARRGASPATRCPRWCWPGEIPPGTPVAGVDIGGLSPEWAEHRLARELTEAADPAAHRAGREEDAAAVAQGGRAVDRPGGDRADAEGSLSPAGVARALFGRTEVGLRVKVDRERLDAAIAKIAKAVDVAPRDGGIRYTGHGPG